MATNLEAIFCSLLFKVFIETEKCDSENHRNIFEKTENYIMQNIQLLDHGAICWKGDFSQFFFLPFEAQLSPRETFSLDWSQLVLTSKKRNEMRVSNSKCFKGAFQSGSCLRRGFGLFFTKILWEARLTLPHLTLNICSNLERQVFNIHPNRMKKCHLAELRIGCLFCIRCWLSYVS